MKWPKHQLNIISKLQCVSGISDENSKKNISGMVRWAMVLVTSWIALAMIFMPSMLYGQTQPEAGEAVYEANSNIAYIMMGHLALTTGGETLVVTNDMEDKLSIIDAHSGQVRGTIPVGKQPHGVAVSADDKRAFVSKRSGSLSVVDIQSEKIMETLDLQGQSEHLSITPGGDYVLVGLKNRFQGEEMDRHGSGNLIYAVAIIDVESLEIINEIPVWSQAHDILVPSTVKE